MKRCARCGQTFAPARERARYCSAACRSAAWKARTGYRDGVAAKSVPNGSGAARRRSQRPRPRAQPLYQVEAVEPDGFRYVGQVKARDAASAITQLADEPEGLYRAIPVSKITEATGAGQRLART